MHVTDDEAEMAILEQSGMTWVAYRELQKARRAVDVVNDLLEKANSSLRWGVLMSSDPRRVR